VEGVSGLKEITWLLFIVVPITPLALELFGFYRRPLRQGVWPAVLQILRAFMLLALATGVMVVFFKFNPSSRAILALAIPMAMATSSSREAVALKAAPHPWLAAIAVRVHGDDPELRQGKPAPDVFLLAARRLGVDPRASWAFEDSPAGAQAAKAAGCQVHVLRPEVIVTQDYPPGVSWLSTLADLDLG
jgi:phosphoglycolate phosphatase-like HAD superfamily hydrolase